ncbi:hypothetical protein GH714_008810 [Hevea brasiliensis]|uniref:Uncharacterized protein n=1 Tax=Hevea brasiliensis TaxID=3981 RepID=A0A6A6LZU8_HEVBR|nr:hypothetical protein GH714_008810 [Hevea brasiliensis]
MLPSNPKKRQRVIHHRHISTATTSRLSSTAALIDSLSYKTATETSQKLRRTSSHPLFPSSSSSSSSASTTAADTSFNDPTTADVILRLFLDPTAPSPTLMIQFPPLIANPTSRSTSIPQSSAAPSISPPSYPTAGKTIPPLNPAIPFPIRAFREDAWRNIVPGLPAVVLRCTSKLANAVAAGTILAARQVRMKLVKDWLPVLIVCKDNVSPMSPSHKSLYVELEETFLRIISTLPMSDAQELLQRASASQLEM